MIVGDLISLLTKGTTLQYIKATDFFLMSWQIVCMATSRIWAFGVIQNRIILLIIDMQSATSSNTEEWLTAMYLIVLIASNTIYSL